MQLMPQLRRGGGELLYLSNQSPVTITFEMSHLLEQIEYLQVVAVLNMNNL